MCMNRKPCVMWPVQTLRMASMHTKQHQERAAARTPVVLCSTRWPAARHCGAVDACASCMQVIARMQMAKAMGAAAEDGAAGALNRLGQLREPGATFEAEAALGIISEALQSTFARLLGPFRAPCSLQRPESLTCVLCCREPWARLDALPLSRA